MQPFPNPKYLGIEWNAENQLVEVLENETTIATFEYDPPGRRVEKVAGGTTTTFTYDAEDILRDTAGATTTYYVHGLASMNHSPKKSADH